MGWLMVDLGHWCSLINGGWDRINPSEMVATNWFLVAGTASCRQVSTTRYGEYWLVMHSLYRYQSWFHNGTINYHHVWFNCQYGS